MGRAADQASDGKSLSFFCYIDPIHHKLSDPNKIGAAAGLVRRKGTGQDAPNLARMSAESMQSAFSVFPGVRVGTRAAAADESFNIRSPQQESSFLRRFRSITTVQHPFMNHPQTHHQQPAASASLLSSRIQGARHDGGSSGSVTHMANSHGCIHD